MEAFRISSSMQRGWSRRGRAAGVGAFLVGLFAGVLALPAAAAEPAPAPPEPGFHTTPSLFWTSGDHRIDLSAATRWRGEIWDAYTTTTLGYNGVRTRVRAQYGWADRILVGAEGQYLFVDGMDPDATGVISTYRSANAGREDVGAFDLRGLWIEARPTKKSAIRIGRQDFKMGGELLATEPDWRYLQAARVGERLVGTVGWSQAERAFDGVGASWDLGGHHLRAFGARPTTGVFAVADAYRPLRDVLLGGGVWTIKRGSLLENTELTAFGLVYDDDRGRDQGGLSGGVEIYTAGGSWLGIYPLGPGKVDVLLWLAGQTGEYAHNDHLAGAAVLEAGYQLPSVFAKPWLRIGLNAASGDGDTSDGQHHTFFNVMPTNHLYYGFLDQLAFQNLVNPFVQLRLTPHPMVGLNLFVHWFRLASEDDGRYSGTGVFNRKSFGFASSASNGSKNVGTEYDAVLTFTPHKAVTIELGMGWLDGGNVFETRVDRDAGFGYASVELRY